MILYSLYRFLIDGSIKENRYVHFNFEQGPLEATKGACEKHGNALKSTVTIF